MTPREYKTQKGLTRYKFIMSSEEYEDMTSSGNVGFCIACGEEADGCEPDARGYGCDCCGEDKVYGLEELLIMNRIEFDAGE